MKMKSCVSLLLGFFLLTTGPLWAAENTEPMVTTMQLQNLTCSSCLVEIGSKLQALEGYIGMEADLAKGLIAIKHDPSLDEGAVAALITVLGYPATIIKGETGTEVAAAGKTGTTGSGCGKSGCCGASSASWKKLIDKIKSK